jgi:hypothetical protein
MTALNDRFLERQGPFGDRAYDVLMRLRDEGWRVRVKDDADGKKVRTDRRTGGKREILEKAIRAALKAYRMTARTRGEQGLPCREAVRAYQRVYPGDARSSERVVGALIQAIQRNPAALMPLQAAAH